MSDACLQCVRRSWLLATLGGCLDFCARDLSRLWSVLELPDMQLVEAIGGRRRGELRSDYARFEPDTAQASNGTRAVCRHSAAYPERLRGSSLAPHTLYVRGRIGRLGEMLDAPVVAVLGTRQASDYGMKIAREMARGLAASGVTVASGLCEGIPVAAHLGALEAHGATLTVMAGGVERCSPAHCASLYGRVTDTGCAVSETPPGVRARGWCEPARARTLALLARLVIVVEAEERPWALACANVAQSHGRMVAAVPGRVSSPVSRGTNALLMRGARLVRDAQDALDVLYGVGARTRHEPSRQLEPRLRRTLEEVGAGSDTVAKLTASGARFADVALALAELELSGLVVRGDGGRYLPVGGLRAG